MAFTAIASSDVDADSPITDTLMQLIRTNFDDHESRILGAEEGGAVALRVVEVGIGVSINTWTKFAEVLVWIPSGVTTLSIRTRLKSSSTGTCNVRMVIQASSTNGSESSVSTTPAAFVDHDNSIAPDATDKGAWGIIEFQCRNVDTGATLTLHKDEETISGVQRNYVGASYWS